MLSEGRVLLEIQKTPADVSVLTLHAAATTTTWVPHTSVSATAATWVAYTLTAVPAVPQGPLFWYPHLISAWGWCPQ